LREDDKPSAVAFFSKLQCIAQHFVRLIKKGKMNADDVLPDSSTKISQRTSHELVSPNVVFFALGLGN
jgi:hypothetical protein